MAQPSLNSTLHDHLSRVRLTTFEQFVGHLLSSKYTAEQYPSLNSGDRRKLARSEVGKAIRSGKEAGRVVERSGVLARGENPRGVLLFDSTGDDELRPENHRALFDCWGRVGRRRITVIYAPESIRFYRRAIADLGPDPVTAELVVSSIYFRLPAEQMERWQPIDDLDGLAPSNNSICRDGTSAVRALAGAKLAPTGRAIFVPVVNYEARPERRPEHEAEFVEFFRWVMGLRAEIADDPVLQVWSPDPESILS